MENLQLEEVCRLCLTKHEDMHSAIEIGAIDKLMECASVVLPSESLICDFCNSEVNKWYSFKQQVLKSLEVAEYVAKQRQKKNELQHNFVMIEECLIKTEIEEELDVKPDISQMDYLIEPQPESVQKSKPIAGKCDLCKKTFYSVSGYITHNRRLHSERTKSQVPSSTKSEEPKPSPSSQEKYQCDLCHKSFISKMGMIWHKQLHSALKLEPSKSKGIPLFKCPFCPMTYEKKLSLTDHMSWKHQRLMKRSSQIFFCDFCGKYFKSKSEYKAHTKSHKGEKQFKCEVCNKSFVRVDTLMLHRKIHTEKEANFACAECGRCFRKEAYLLSHKSTHERLYK